MNDDLGDDRLRDKTYEQRLALSKRSQPITGQEIRNWFSDYVRVDKEYIPQSCELNKLADHFNSFFVNGWYDHNLPSRLQENARQQVYADACRLLHSIESYKHLHDYNEWEALKSLEPLGEITDLLESINAHPIPPKDEQLKKKRGAPSTRLDWTTAGRSFANAANAALITSGYKGATSLQDQNSPAVQVAIQAVHRTMGIGLTPASFVDKMRPSKPKRAATPDVVLIRPV